MAVVNNPKLYNNPADKSTLKTESKVVNYDQSEAEWKKMIKKICDDSENVIPEVKVETKVVVSNTGIEISTEKPITIEAETIRTLGDVEPEEDDGEKQSLANLGDKYSKKYGKKKNK